jgi:hypothetical protein
VDIKSLDVATGCQIVMGNKCHSGPNVQWTFRGGRNVTRTFRGWTFRQGTGGSWVGELMSVAGVIMGQVRLEQNVTLIHGLVMVHVW